MSCWCCQKETKICRTISEIPQGWKKRRHLSLKQQYIKISSAVQKKKYFSEYHFEIKSVTLHLDHHDTPHMWHCSNAPVCVYYTAGHSVVLQLYFSNQKWVYRLSLIFCNPSRFFPVPSFYPPPLLVSLSSSLPLSVCLSLSLHFFSFYWFGLPPCFTRSLPILLSAHYCSLFFCPLRITAPSLFLFFFLSLYIAAHSLTLTFSAPSPPPLSIYILPSPTAASHFFPLILSPSSSPRPSSLHHPPSSIPFIPCNHLFSLSLFLSPSHSLWLHSLLRPHFVLCHFTPSSMLYLFCCLPHPLDVLYQKVKSNDRCHLSKNVPQKRPTWKYFLVCFDLCCWTTHVSP